MDFKKIALLRASQLLAMTILTSFSLISCGTQLYIPIKSVENLSVTDLKKGRELYVNHCGSCHQLYLPKQFKTEIWARNLDEMQVRSKITDTEKRMIYDYLTNE